MWRLSIAALSLAVAGCGTPDRAGSGASGVVDCDPLFRVAGEPTVACRPPPVPPPLTEGNAVDQVDRQIQAVQERLRTAPPAK
jgi:hypothetical protein